MDARAVVFLRKVGGFGTKTRCGKPLGVDRLQFTSTRVHVIDVRFVVATRGAAQVTVFSVSGSQYVLTSQLERSACGNVAGRQNRVRLASKAGIEQV